MPQPVAAIDRPLSLRLRPDLTAVPVAMAGSSTWVIHDPITLEHFQFSAAEYALLDWLRQPISISGLLRRFAEDFAPQTLTPQAVWDFLGRLHEAGLLVSDGSHQGHELLDRMRRDRMRRWAMSWSGLLAIRFRGFDPDAFLTAIHVRLRWLVSPLGLIAAVAVVLWAASLVVGHVDEFRQRLPELSALFDPRNLPWLFLTIGFVKVLHELGHALACKHWGGEVRELGLMLLVFAPCLYCDVSDAWRLPSKWQRMAVSAGGIAVEIVLAAVATMVWWYAQPGILQLMAMNVMVVCTVGTLVVNGNPLLRYDGYYILSDLVEIPNLWQRSRDVLQRLISRVAFGQAAAGDPLLPDRYRGWLVGYALASKLYLTLVCVAIVWSLVQLLYPLHLQNLAYAAGLTMLGSAVASPVRRAWQCARSPVRRAELRSGRLALLMATGLALGVAVLALPVDYYVSAPLVLMPDGAARIFATLDGTLVRALSAGQRVARGDTIAQLRNLQVEQELMHAEGEQRLRELRVRHLERLRGTDPQANDELPTARAALADAERRLDDRRRELARLTLTAPVAGVVLPAPQITRARPSSLAARRSNWPGSLLEVASIGTAVETGTLVCLVGDSTQLTATLLVNDADIKRLRPGQPTRLQFDQLPGHVLAGQVVDVSRRELDGLDTAPHASSDLASLFSGAIPAGTQGAHYEARVLFAAPAQPLIMGGRGQAKVAAERITLARRIVRFLGQQFRLPI